METADEIHEKYKNYSTDQFIQEIIGFQNRVVTLEHFLFGSRKERLTEDPVGMKNMFDEFETLVDDDESSEGEENSTSDEIPEKKKRGKRSKLPANLPRRRVDIDLAEADKFCKKHGIALERIGATSVEKLEIIPAKVEILEEVTHQYKCPCCDKEDEKSTIVRPIKDPDPIPKSFATAGLLAYLATAKFEDALPLYRQEKIFARYGIELDRTTMARWMIKMGKLCQPLINLMMDDLLDSKALHADETTVQVLKEPNRRPEQKSYMWCLARSYAAPIILFRYFDNRSKNSARQLLDGFEGFLTADGYNVYGSLAKDQEFTLSGCLAHARRKFWLAEKEAKRASKGKNPILAARALKFIKELYAIEESIRERPPDEKIIVRQKQSKPIMDAFYNWLIETQEKVLPKSLTGKAVSYALRQWENLGVFCESGIVPIDNNYLESHIRPFVIGRGNWMFSATQDGANASATLYSLVETAKANGISAFSYLTIIFKELAKDNSLDELTKLLPYNVAAHYQVDSYSCPN